MRNRTLPGAGLLFHFALSPADFTSMVHFRQILDAPLHTCTYLLVEKGNGEAALIDPVREEATLYLALLEELDAHLALVADTHVHEDHLSAAALLRSLTGAKVVAGSASGVLGADMLASDGCHLAFGGEHLSVLATPGHTAGCVSYGWRDRVFTGDTLWIGDCSRVDLPESNPGTLYDSITHRLLTLADETLVYPGHTFDGRRVSCIGSERAHNRRIAGRTRDEFITVMSQAFGPRRPRHDPALRRANLRCGDFAVERNEAASAGAGHSLQPLARPFGPRGS